MKALILSITTGGGHNSSAKALMREMEQLGAECVFADAFQTVSNFLYKTVDNVYKFCGGAGRHLYGAFYHIAEKQIGNRFNAGIAARMNKRRAPKLIKLIEAEKPDVILYTHVFAGELLEAIRKQGKLDIPCLGIVTDFTIHPSWERITNLGHIILANEDLAPIAIERGYKPEQLHSLGIPIHPSFAEITPKAQARKELGLAEDGRYVLVMCGSMGYGNPAKLVAAVDRSEEDFRFLVVCGHSKHTYQKMSKLKTRHEMTVYGFTDKVRLLMDSADCLISKPGGLSVCEAFARKMPLLIVNPIPGHEVRNVQFLCARNAAVQVKDYKTPAEAVDHYFKNPEFVQTLSEGAAALARPNAVKDIAALAVEFAKAHAEKVAADEAAAQVTNAPETAAPETAAPESGSAQETT